MRRIQSRLVPFCLVVLAVSAATASAGNTPSDPFSKVSSHNAAWFAVTGAPLQSTTATNYDFVLYSALPCNGGNSVGSVVNVTAGADFTFDAGQSYKFGGGAAYILFSLNSASPADGNYFLRVVPKNASTNVFNVTGGAPCLAVACNSPTCTYSGAAISTPLA